MHAAQALTSHIHPLDCYTSIHSYVPPRRAGTLHSFAGWKANWACCAAALDTQSAVMEEEQLEERDLGMNGDADSRKEAQTIIEGDENDINEAQTDDVSQVHPAAL